MWEEVSRNSRWRLTTVKIFIIITTLNMLNNKMFLNDNFYSFTDIIQRCLVFMSHIVNNVGNVKEKCCKKSCLSSANLLSFCLNQFVCDKAQLECHQTAAFPSLKKNRCWNKMLWSFLNDEEAMRMSGGMMKGWGGVRGVVRKRNQFSKLNYSM